MPDLAFLAAQVRETTQAAQDARDARDAELLRRYDQGATLDELAAESGYARAYVHRRIVDTAAALTV